MGKRKIFFGLQAFVSLAIFFQNCAPSLNRFGTLSSGDVTLPNFIQTTPENVNAESVANPITFGSEPAEAPQLLGDVEIRSTGLLFAAKYPSCPTASVYAQLWILSEKNEFNFQNRCLLNAPLGKDQGGRTIAGGQGLCHFRAPVAGLAGEKIILQMFPIQSDCKTYVPGNAVNVSFPGKTAKLDDYNLPLKFGTQLVVEKKNFTAKFDRNGGALYEFYNKRAANPSNMIHADMGAAAQMAFHDLNDAEAKAAARAAGTQPLNRCISDVGYWNPTQTGAFCSGENADGSFIAPVSPTSVAGTFCDGVRNDRCASATSTIDFGAFRMMNWDYSPGYYEGPYHTLDTLWLKQKTTATDDFVELNLEVQNLGVVRKVTAETMALYLTSAYRRFFYRQTDGDNKIKTETVPEFTEIGGVVNRYMNEGINWVTFENSVTNDPKDVLTFAWFFDEQAVDDRVPFPQGLKAPSGKDMSGIGWRSWQIFAGTHPSNVKFVPLQIMNLKQKNYKFKYVLFPYRYDEQILFRGQTKTIEQVIDVLRFEHLVQNNSIRGHFEKPNASTIFGWTCLPGESQPMQVDVYVGGPFGTGTKVGAAKMGLATDGEVAKQCQTDFKAYGFHYIFSEEEMANHRGKKIFAHGMNIFKAQNTLLGGSGVYEVSP